MSTDPPAIVTPRDAASLLVLRPGPAGLEVLMGLRGAGHKFMPNRLVFPGGAVDPEDFHPPAGLRPETRRRLETAASPALAGALAVAACRELEEETGLTLGTPPSLDRLEYLCRAVTPPGRPIRFDARFLVTSADAVTGTLAGSGELEGLRYYRLEDAMRLDLAHATRSVLEKLLEWLVLTPDQRAARPTKPALIKQVWIEE